MASSGKDWRGKAGLGRPGMVWFGSVRFGRAGKAGRREVRHREVGWGTAG